MICGYGCNQEAKHQLKNDRWCCSKSQNGCPAIRLKNSKGLSKAHKEGRLTTKHFDGKRAWSKGLTKETDERVKRIAEKISKTLTGNPKNTGLASTVELEEKRRKKLSEARIKYLETHNAYCKWYSVKCENENVKVQGTWEQSFAEKLNELSIKWNRHKLEYNGYRKYTPDFYLVDYDVYVEIKGFFRDRDKYKLYLVRKDNNINIKIIENKKFIENIKNVKDILKISNYFDNLKLRDIDFSKFDNVWKDASVVKRYTQRV